MNVDDVETDRPNSYFQGIGSKGQVRTVDEVKYAEYWSTTTIIQHIKSKPDSEL